RAGWLRWSDELSPKPLRPGKGPIALRVHLGGPGFDLTEAGTKKGMAVWLVRDPNDVASVATLGSDAATLSRDDLAELLAGRTERLKNAITDQRLIAGIGNAYSDEILHTARLSPYATAGRLDDDALDRLPEAMGTVLRDAVERAVGPAGARLNGSKGPGR